MHKQVSLA